MHMHSLGLRAKSLEEKYLLDILTILYQCLCGISTTCAALAFTFPMCLIIRCGALYRADILLSQIETYRRFIILLILGNLTFLNVAGWEPGRIISGSYWPTQVRYLS
jgi:hypothetical protein